MRGVGAIPDAARAAVAQPPRGHSAAGALSWRARPAAAGLRIAAGPAPGLRQVVPKGWMHRDLLAFPVPGMTGCGQLAQPARRLSVTRLTPPLSACRYLTAAARTGAAAAGCDGPVTRLDLSPSPAGAAAALPPCRVPSAWSARSSLLRPGRLAPIRMSTARAHGPGWHGAPDGRDGRGGGVAGTPPVPVPVGRVCLGAVARGPGRSGAGATPAMPSSRLA
jgi:hypothetical protein